MRNEKGEGVMRHARALMPRRHSKAARRTSFIRRLATVAAVMTVGLVFAAAANALVTYVSYQVFTAGESHGGSYDNSSPWWVYNEIAKNQFASGRVSFIDGGGGWHCTYQDSNLTTWCQILQGYEFNKKPHCDNNAAGSYYASCEASK